MHQIRIDLILDLPLSFVLYEIEKLESAKRFWRQGHRKSEANTAKISQQNTNYCKTKISKFTTSKTILKTIKILHIGIWRRKIVLASHPNDTLKPEILTYRCLLSSPGVLGSVIFRTSGSPGQVAGTARSETAQCINTCNYIANTWNYVEVFRHEPDKGLNDVWSEQAQNLNPQKYL